MSPKSLIAIPRSNRHENLITLQRRNCVILVHNETRFPVFIKSLIEADYAEFDWHFSDTLLNTLLKLGANLQQLDAAVKLCAPCRFDSMFHRSVQGTMNDVKFTIEHMLWDDNIYIEDLRIEAGLGWHLHLVV